MAQKEDSGQAAKRFEEQYRELMKVAQVPLPTPPYRDNLEQPGFLKVVETRTTYGAYEEPI